MEEAERFTFKMPASTLDELKAVAATNDVSAAWVARRFVEEGLRRIKSGEMQLPFPFRSD